MIRGERMAAWQDNLGSAASPSEVRRFGGDMLEGGQGRRPGHGTGELTADVISVDPSWCKGIGGVRRQRVAPAPFGCEARQVLDEMFGPFRMQAEQLRGTVHEMRTFAG